MFNEEQDWAGSSSSSSESTPPSPRSSAAESDSDDSSGFFDIDPYLKEKQQQQKQKQTSNISTTSAAPTSFKQKQFRQSDEVLENLLPTNVSGFETLRREKNAAKNSVSILSANNGVPQPQKSRVSGFHKPGDAAFSLVAVPPEHLLNREGENVAKRDNNNSKINKNQNNNKRGNNSNNKFSGSDAQGIGSSVWASSECRCLRCEILRTSQRWAVANTFNNHQMMKKKQTLVILMDADNFGFPAFSRKPPSNALFQFLTRMEKDENSDIGGVFVWAFYGANFEKAFNVDLEHYVKNSFTEKKTKNNNNNQDRDDGDNNDGSNNNNKLPKHLNTWGLLQSKKSVQCTRCEGSSQAADLVIEAVATMLGDEIGNENNNVSSSVRLSLLTGDKGLRNSIQEIWSKAAATTVARNNDDDNEEEGNKSPPQKFFIPDFSELLTKQRTEENFVLDSDIIWRTLLSGFSTSKKKNHNTNKKFGQRRQRE